MTTFEPGEVYEYDYLWRHQSIVGEESGRTARPSALIFRSSRRPGELFLLAITTQQPPSDRQGIEVPRSERSRCGLNRPSWIILDEFNQTLETRTHDFRSTVPLGTFSPAFTRRVARLLATLIRAGLVSPVIRS